MEEQTSLESASRQAPISLSMPSVAHTRDNTLLPAEATLSLDRRTSDFNTATFPRHGRITTRRESTYILVLLNAYTIMLSLAWYLSHYDELDSMTTVLKPLFASVLSLLHSRYQNQADKLPVQSDGTLVPWSYDSVGNSIALHNFCRVMISGFFNPPSRFNNSNSITETSLWLLSSICLVAYYVLPILFTQFSRWETRSTAMNLAFISDLKKWAGLLIMLPHLLFSLPTNVQAPFRNSQAVASLPDITTVLSLLVSYAVGCIVFSSYNRIFGRDYGPINAKSALISDFKALTASLIIAQLIPVILTEPSEVLELLAQEFLYIHTLMFSKSATDFLIFHLYYQAPRSAGRLKRVLFLLVAVTAIAYSLLNNPYLTPAGCPTRHISSHACYSQISLNDPMSLQKQAFCYENYKIRKGGQEIANYLAEKSTIIASSCSEDQLTLSWINSCTDLHSHFALLLHSGSGVTASPQKYFVIATLCLGIFRPREESQIPLFLRQDEMIAFFHLFYFPQYPESKRLLSKSPLYLRRGSHFVLFRWNLGF